MPPSLSEQRTRSENTKLRCSSELICKPSLTDGDVSNFLYLCREETDDSIIVDNANRAAQAQSKIKVLEKLPELEPPEADDVVKFK